MKIPTLLLSLLCGCVLAAAGEPKPFEKLVPADGDSIVFLGDSITAQCLYTQYIENYFYTRYPRQRLHFHNAGVSGDTVADALARFDADVAAYRPNYVAILLGMNDGASKEFEPALFETYRTGMAQLVGKIRALGATPLFLGPTMYDLHATELNPKNDSRGRGGYYNGVLALYGTWLREFASQQRAGFVDFHGPLNALIFQQRRAKPDFTFIPDGIHPDANGQLVMACEFVSDLGLSKRSFAITISREPGDGARAQAIGAKVIGTAYAGDGLAFTVLPKALPMPVPADATAGAQLISFGPRWSSETLTVHGLPVGTYRLLIENVEVGLYDAAALAAKVDIGDNPKSPLYQQAARVTALNARRHTESVLPIRELWRWQKIVSRVRADLAAHPDDPAIQRRLAAHSQRLVNFDADLAKCEAAGRAIEDEIYRANQPAKLNFRLERVGGKPLSAQ